MTFCGDTSSCQGLVESISVQRGSVIKYFNQRFYFMFYRRAHEWRREQIQSLWSFDYTAIVRWVFTQSTQLSVFFTRCSSTHDSRRRILRAEKMDFKPRLEDGKIYIEVSIFWHHDKKFSAVFFIYGRRSCESKEGVTDLQLFGYSVPDQWQGAYERCIQVLHCLYSIDKRTIIQVCDLCKPCVPVWLEY